jgi:hypothetical protein
MIFMLHRDAKKKLMTDLLEGIHAHKQHTLLPSLHSDQQATDQTK